MPAHATGGCRGNQPCNDDEVLIDIDADVALDNNSSSSSTSSADSSSTSGATASSDNSVTINENHPESVTLRNVASPDTPNPYPTAPCRVGVSGGLSLAGGALSGGGSIEDEECTLRETARSFKDLGVPEVGLYLLCTQSDVVLGRRDKKGELEKGEPDPLGSEECLRLVREFQGDVDDTDVVGAVQHEVEVIREQQDRVERELAARVEQLEMEISKPQRQPAPVVRQETIQQPMLTEEKRAKLAALFPEEDEK